MARYANTDKLKTDILMKYKKHWEVPCSSEDRLIQSIVTDLRVLIEKNTTADVAPRAEVAREIFEEIEELFRQHKEGGYYLNGAWFPERLDLYTEDAFEELKKKYTEGEK